MAGAEFVRVDLHVHTYGDGDGAPDPDFKAYVEAAVDAGVQVLAVTDHNTCRFAQAMMDAAKGAELLVLPGVEISTHDGHLLAVFGPDGLDELQALCNPENLKLTKLSDTERRSTRSMLDLVQEIDKRGGLAIPAHVDSAGGIHEKLGSGELAELLASPALVGLEFHHKDALETWFTDGDEDAQRVAAWKARGQVDELRDRGLARLQSSDAHSPEKVGLDRGSRVLTRLRLDDVNFAAVRLAVQLNPKARCKAEAVLPASYPRILSAQFEGGFLDGVEMEFSPNLNCVIGGRGSGKSTALLAVRAALGARLGPDEDPDEEERMPEMTRVRYIDTTGSERVARRERGGEPVDAESGGPIKVRLADLGQGESGRWRVDTASTPGTFSGFSTVSWCGTASTRRKGPCSHSSRRTERSFGGRLYKWTRSRTSKKTRNDSTARSKRPKRARSSRSHSGQRCSRPKRRCLNGWTRTSPN
jgi:hypothetical protein